MKIAGGTAFSLPSCVREGRQHLSDNVDLVFSNATVVLTLGGKTAFEIDPKRFGGKPLLEVRDVAKSKVIVLRDAFLPGLTVPLDLQFEVWDGVFGPNYKLLFPKLGLAFRGALLEWLAKESPCQATHRHEIRGLGSQFEVKLAGIGTASFTPDWAMTFKGRSLGVLSLEFMNLPFDELTFSLPERSAPSLLRWTSSKRSLTRVHRGVNDWTLFPSFASGNGFQLEPSGNLFCAVEIESCENRSGPNAAFLANSPETAELRGRPEPNFKTPVGNVFALRLHAIRYGGVLGTFERYLSSNLSDSELNLGETVFLLRDNPNLPALEIHADRNGTIERRITPALEMSIATPEAVVATASLPRSSGVPLSFGGLLCRTADFLHLNCEHHKAISVTRGLRVRVLRPRDLLQIEFEFAGIQIEHAFGRSHLVPTGDPQDAKIVVHFPPQSITEHAPYAADPSCQTAPSPANALLLAENVTEMPPVKARLAKPSRLVFRPFKKSHSRHCIDFSLQSLMNWSEWELVVAKSASPPVSADGRPDLSRIKQLLKEFHAPTPLETSIELPYRLIISPTQDAKFTGTEDPVRQQTTRTELWHTWMQIPHKQGKDSADIRLVATREEVGEFCPSGNPQLCEVAIEPGDRRELLRQFTTYDGTTTQGDIFTPPVLSTRLLALSALGGWIDGTSEWNPEMSHLPSGTHSIQSWRQLTKWGRDEVIQLGFGGFLMPTGHPAILIKIAQREWVGKGGKHFAYIVKRCYLQLPQKTMSYPGVGQRNNARDLPFHEISFSIKQTPYLDPDNCTASGAFWVKVCQQLYQFPVENTDVEGGTAGCTLPMMFVFRDEAFPTTSNKASLANAISLYRNYSGPDANISRTSQISSVRIAFARSAKRGDTSLTTHTFKWNISEPTAARENELRRAVQPPWYPTLEHAEVSIDAAQAMGDSSCISRFEYHPTYIENGFTSERESPNSGEVFFRSLDDSSSFSFPGNKSAGLVLPSVKIGAFSRRLGIVGGTAVEAANSASLGNFDAQSFFRNSDATLLGAVKLADVVANVIGFVDQSQRVPKLVQNEIHDFSRQYSIYKEEIAAAISQFHSIADLCQQYAQKCENSAAAINAAIPRPPVPGSVTQAAENILQMIGYRETPSQLLKKAADTLLKQPADTDETLKANIEYVRTNFQTVFNDLAAHVRNPTLQRGALPNVALAREYIVYKITERGEFTEQQLTALRNQFRFSAEGMLGTLTSEFEHVVSDLQSSLFGKLPKDVIEIKDAIQSADVIKVADGLSNLASDLQDFGGSLESRAVSQLQRISQNVYSRVHELSSSAKATLDSIGSAVEQPVWGLTPDERGAVNKYFAAVNERLSGELGTCRKVLSDQLYSEDLKAAGALANEATQTLGQAAKYEQFVKDAISQIRRLLDQLRYPIAIDATYHFEPVLQDAPAGNPVFRAQSGGKPARLSIDSKIHKRFDGTPANVNTHAILTDCELRLFPFAPFLEIAFDKIEFTSQNGDAPQVSVKVADSRFVGPLDFIRKLQEKLKALDGSSANGPYLNIRADGLESGFKFAIPSITTGAFNLSHLRFSTSLRLPFSGEPTRLRFAFSDRAHPCILTYGIFGGTAFVALEATARGIEQVEGALEFGAAAELNIAGIAHGAVQMMAGFYFKQRSGTLSLSGYFRATGELSIAGLLTMTVTFCLALSFEQRSDASYLVGECSLTVERASPSLALAIA